MSRVLLTGASGFIGRQTVPALQAAGHEVHAVARRRGPEMPGVTWHEVELMRAPGIAAALRPEILIHLAWYAEHGRYWTSPENVRWVEASLALLRGFVRGGGRRALIAGTCAEYEWSRDVYPEDAPQRPATLYGAAKHGLHITAAAFARQAGFELAWARLFFLYGPHEPPERFVPSLTRTLLSGARAPMTAGTQRRDFLYVEDAAAALVAVADSVVTGAVNVASGEGVALRDLAAQIAGQVGADARLAVGALPQRPGEPRSLVADVRRLHEQVGWRPRVALGEGIERTVDWWRTNDVERRSSSV